MARRRGRVGDYATKMYPTQLSRCVVNDVDPGRVDVFRSPGRRFFGDRVMSFQVYGNRAAPKDAFQESGFFLFLGFMRSQEIPSGKKTQEIQDELLFFADNGCTAKKSQNRSRTV